jgi:hypothetical protein
MRKKKVIKKKVEDDADNEEVQAEAAAEDDNDEAIEAEAAENGDGKPKQRHVKLDENGQPMKRKVIKKKPSNIEDEVAAEDDADIDNEEVQAEAAESGDQKPKQRRVKLDENGQPVRWKKVIKK